MQEHLGQSRRWIKTMPQKLQQELQWGRCFPALALVAFCTPASAGSILERVLADIAADAPVAGQTDVMMNIAEVVNPATDPSILNRIDGSTTLVSGDLMQPAAIGYDTTASTTADLVWREIDTQTIASSNTGTIEVAKILPMAPVAVPEDIGQAGTAAATGAAQPGGYAVLLGNLAVATTTVIGSISLRTENITNSGATVVQQATSSIGTINSGGITLKITQDSEGVAQ